MVTAGSHTLGVTYCDHLADRIFPPIVLITMPKALLRQMQRICPLTNTTTPIVIDRHSMHKFDTCYYNNIVDRNGIMTSDDQDLYTNEIVLRKFEPDCVWENFSDSGKMMLIKMPPIRADSVGRPPRLSTIPVNIKSLSSKRFS